MCFTYGWFCDVLPVAGLEDGAHQSLDATHLAHGDLVMCVVTRQVGKDASGAGDDVDIVGRQHLGEHLEKTFHRLVLRGGKNKYR